MSLEDDQYEVCRRFRTHCMPPRSDQLVVISAGVVEGDAVEGVRYPSPEHMSGWWITTDRYDGDSKSLTLHHLHHLVEWRPDIAPYLALPFGFRFVLGEAEHVWFDEVVASEDAA